MYGSHKGNKLNSGKQVGKKRKPKKKPMKKGSYDK